MRLQAENSRRPCFFRRPPRTDCRGSSVLRSIRSLRRFIPTRRRCRKGGCPVFLLHLPTQGIRSHAANAIMGKRLSLLRLSPGCSLAASAAESCTLRGRVTDRLTRQPVAYAAAVLDGQGDKGASTDSAGRFAIERVRASTGRRPSPSSTCASTKPSTSAAARSDSASTSKTPLRAGSTAPTHRYRRAANPEAPADRQRYRMESIGQSSGALLPTLGATIEF